jgi:hypothetical protein
MGLGSEIRDPEKNLFRIPDPGIKKAPYPRSGSATLQGGQTLEQCPQLQPHHMFWLLLRSSELHNKVRPLYTFKKKNRKSLGMYFFMKKMVKIYNKYLLFTPF